VIAERSARRYAFALWALLGLFAVRVGAQLLIALGGGDFLPPWEEWFSGALRYPPLLVSQIVIILVLGRIALDVTRGRGAFAVPRRPAAVALFAIGSVYLAVMVIRYAIRMTLYPHERWAGGSIPIFFHWVLAGFILVLGFYHRRFAPRAPSSLRAIRARAVQSVVSLLAILGIAGFVGYQLAPTLLARVLGSRPAEYAVRIDRRVPMTTSDGVALLADIYRPVRAGATPTILVRIPFSKTIVNSLFATIVGRFWAERGYTAVIQGTRGRYESGGDHYPLIHERRDGLETLAWLKRQPWFDGRLGMWGGSAFGHTQWAVADQLPAAPFGRSANSTSGDGELSAAAPTEREPPDSFESDPQNPVPTRGGAMIGDGSGVARQDDVELRRDVLVYTTAPLADDVEVTGPLTATLYVATSAPHTDFTAKLVDVQRDGTPYNVSDGILRRKYAASSDPPTAEPVPIDVSLWPTSMVFRQGHRIRLEVASSNFPRYDRNPNTGAPIATARATAVARQAVHHGPQALSRIVLPVVPRAR
jgi:X-Pro dipeptidyl-peptidase-like protein